MDWRRLGRIGLASALACLLSACWMSEKPLIGARDAAAVPFAGTYHGDGDETPKRMIIAATGGASYELLSGKEDRVPATFAALGGDWYLMQGEGHSDEEGTPPFYLYQLVQRRGDDLYFYSPGCEDISGSFEGLKREAGEVESCNFSRLDGLEAMARAWIGKLRKGGVADEPEILRHGAR